MTFTHLLDTNVVSRLMRDPRGSVAEHLRRVGEARVCTSVVVACELRFGVEKKGSAQLAHRLETVLRGLPVLSLEAPADTIYGRIRALLERSGRSIGGNDLLIAAHALALGCCVVTDNTEEFARVPGLVCETWSR